jgi:hypothetical protein
MSTFSQSVLSRSSPSEFSLRSASQSACGSLVAALGNSASRQSSFTRSLLGILLPGFVGGHVFDSLLYHPKEVLARPETGMARSVLIKEAAASSA